METDDKKVDFIINKDKYLICMLYETPVIN